jgi:hypothetical protein
VEAFEGAAGAAAGEAALPSEGLLSVEVLAASVPDAAGALPSSAFLAGALGEAYRSEYQPPPFRMKLVPALIRRCAEVRAHFGHSSIGGSVILWVCSHAWPHAAHAYS